MAARSRRAPSIILIALVGLTMAGLAAYAVIPAPQRANSGAPTGSGLRIAALDNADAPLAAADVPAPSSPAPQAPDVLRPSLHPLPLVIAKAEPQTPPPPAARAEGPEDLGLQCVTDASGRRIGLPLDVLVRLAEARIDSLGVEAGPGAVHTLVQADLFRSGDDPHVKELALEQLKTRYAQNAAATAALAQPFDLTQKIAGLGVDYDRCAAPAILGGASPFQKGPFAGDFVTVNPLPVIATRLASTGEGRHF